MFMEYVNNCNVTRQQVLEIFQIVKEKLGITQWSTTDTEEVKVYGRARQIAIKVWACNVNLFLIQEKINHGEITDMKIINLINFNNYKEFPFDEFIAEFQDEIFKHKNSNPII